MQKVSVYLDEKGMPAMGELVTQSVIQAVCANFNELMKKGLVLVKFDYTEHEPMNIFGDDHLMLSYAQPIRPTIRLEPQPNGNQAIMQILMPK